MSCENTEDTILATVVGRTLGTLKVSHTSHRASCPRGISLRSSSHTTSPHTHSPITQPFSYSLPPSLPLLSLSSSSSCLIDSSTSMNNASHSSMAAMSVTFHLPTSARPRSFIIDVRERTSETIGA